MSSNELEEYRKKIDSLDERIVKLLDERMKIALQVGGYKKKHGLEIVYEKREEEVLGHVKKILKKWIEDDAVKEVYRQIIAETVKAEERLKEGNE